MVAFFVLAGVCAVMLTLAMVRGTATPDFFHPAQALEAPRLESGPRASVATAAPEQPQARDRAPEAGAAPAASSIGLAVVGTLIEQAAETARAGADTADRDREPATTARSSTDRKADRDAAKAQRKADRDAAKAQRKADRDAAKAQRKAERDAAKAQRKAERDAAKAQRKAERDAAKAQRKAERDAAKASRGKGRG